MEVWVRLSLVHFKGRSRKSSFRTYLDMKLFRSMTDLTPIPGSCQPFQGNESHYIRSSCWLPLIPFWPQCLSDGIEGFQRGAVCRFFRHAGRHRASIAVDAAIGG